MHLFQNQVGSGELLKKIYCELNKNKLKMVTIELIIKTSILC